jgi:ribosomal subunit interface protein
MEIEIQAHHIELSQKLKAHIQRKLLFSLNRFEKHISEVSIELSDVNGQKSGLDKQCRIQIILRNMEDITIKDTQASLYLAIDRAMQRADRSVARQINHNTSRKINGRK